MRNKDKSLLEQLEEIRRNPIKPPIEEDMTEETIGAMHERIKPPSKTNRVVTQFIETHLGEPVRYTKYTMQTLNYTLIWAILLVVYLLALLSLTLYLGILVFPLMTAGSILLLFAMMQRELAYFDDERIVDFRSTDLFLQKFKRTEYRFSEMQQVEQSFYRRDRTSMVLWRILLKDGTCFDIRMSCILNDTFIDVLTFKLRTLNILKIIQ